MQALEHRIPPPLVTLVIAAAMWLAPGAGAATGIRAVAGAAVALAGLLSAASGLLAFRKASTTVDPRRPGDAAAVVTGGAYRFTRNPMYLGLTCLLLGWAIYLGSNWLLLGPAAFMLFITRFQIIPEERALLAKFGPGYAAYTKRVRRWL